MPQADVVDAVSMKPSISVRFVRHAESMNNEVYREARRLHGGGTPQYDVDGWTRYVDLHRRADPGLSPKGQQQATRLAEYLVPKLSTRASHQVRFVISPMRRVVLTMLPTLVGMLDGAASAKGQHDTKEGFEAVRPYNKMRSKEKCEVVINAFFHESEGCHLRDVPGKSKVPIVFISPLFGNSWQTVA